MEYFYTPLASVVNPRMWPPYSNWSHGQESTQSFSQGRGSFLIENLANRLSQLRAGVFTEAPTKLTPTSPTLGTIMNIRRVPAWNQGDNPILPPPLRETNEEWRPSGYSYDPRVAIIKRYPRTTRDSGNRNGDQYLRSGRVESRCLL
jgi:hypothetical protein